jgi:long-chain acyl-CoA synthetase
MPKPSLSEILQAGLYRGGAERAIDFEGRWHDCEWVRSVANRIDESMRAGAIARRAPVAVIPRNRPPVAVALIALLIAEHPIRMIYAFQSSEGKARDIRALRPAVVIADERDWDALTLAAVEEVGAQAIALHAGLAAEDSATVQLEPDAQRYARASAPEAAQGIEMLTSGTTGPPKRIFISTEVLASMAGERFVNNETTESMKPVSLIFPPFGNVAGLYALLPAAASRSPFALLEKFTVAGWCGAVERNRIPVAGIPPAGLRMILEDNVAPEQLSSLSHVYSGAAPLEHEVQDAFEAKYGIPVVLSYGATEFGGPVTSMTPALRQTWGPSKRHSVGQPFAGCRLRIVSMDTGQPLAAKQEGLIEVMSPRVGSHWNRTSDLGLLDEDGFLYLRGRADRTINRGGFKVSPDLIVDALRKHPSVAAAAAIGFPDVQLGQVPVAAVELKGTGAPASESELMAHARSHLYTMLVPTQIKIVRELPRNQSFKVDLAAVEKLFSAAEAQRHEA